MGVSYGPGLAAGFLLLAGLALGLVLLPRTSPSPDTEVMVDDGRNGGLGLSSEPEPSLYQRRICEVDNQTFPLTNIRKSSEPGDTMEYTIVSLPDVAPVVHTNVCSNPGHNNGVQHPALTGEHWCRQEYVEVPLAARVIAFRTVTDQIVIKRFKFPHGCTCYIDGAPVCAVEDKNIRPLHRRTGRPEDPTEYTIINMPDFVQTVETRLCLYRANGHNKGWKHMNGHKHFCKQEYIEVPLVSLVQGTEDKIAIKMFSIPHGCSCYLDD